MCFVLQTHLRVDNSKNVDKIRSDKAEEQLILYKYTLLIGTKGIFAVLVNTNEKTK